MVLWRKKDFAESKIWENVSGKSLVNRAYSTAFEIGYHPELKPWEKF